MRKSASKTDESERKLSKKQVTDEQKTEYMVRLALNRYDYEKTSAETGIAISTLRSWDKSMARIAVPELLERAVKDMLMRLPTNFDPRDWAITIGILLDKWILLQGGATQRIETINSILEGTTIEERENILAEARRIISESGGRFDAGTAFDEGDS